MPGTNVDFWRAKFEANVRRDTDAIEALKTLGWDSLVVWECETDARGLKALYSQIASITSVTGRH